MPFRFWKMSKDWTTLCLFGAAFVFAFIFSPAAPAAFKRCESFLSRLVNSPSLRNTHSDVIELNKLLRKYRHRKNIFMVVNDHTVTGFISRSFVEESKIRVDGKPTPSNSMIFPLVHKDRESGIREIMESVSKVDVEHAWAYLPTKQLWVDVTLAVAEHSVYMDPQLLAALHKAYGPIEIFHTHPEKLVDEVRRKRQFKMSHLVSGSAPSGGDLAQIIGFAWNWDRSIPFFSGIIHPLGVTYYAVTQELLRSNASPPIADVGNTFYNLELRSNDLESDTQTLIRMQTLENSIQKFDGATPGPEAFAMRFFSPKDFHQIPNWLTGNAASLSKEEAAVLAELRRKKQR